MFSDDIEWKMGASYGTDTADDGRIWRLGESKGTLTVGSDNGI